MKIFILGSLVSLAALIYFTNSGKVDSDSDLKIVKTSTVDKDSRDVKIIYKEDSKEKMIHTSKNLTQNSNLLNKKPTSITQAQSQQNNKEKLTYEGMQSAKRMYYTQLEYKKKLYQQREQHREMLLKKHQNEQKFIAMQSIQSQKIKRQRIESTNLRYKSMNEKNMQKNISEIKKNINS